jgi:hypothetical protein
VGDIEELAGPEVGAKSYNAIEESVLAPRSPEGRRLIERRDPEPGVELAKTPHGQLEVGDPVSEVGAEADEDLCRHD